ncbi:ABC transporter permease [Pontibacter kalidii]|uniref:ABC transporter permease n=1 Tax=Pontibacter kalidii TaxID=2592049 RepID=UPI00224D1D7B|nr:ABC transporter permease [Pontibacter kalidii]
MLSNYLLIFFRNMARNKVYAAINIIGLAIGIASCILIYLYVQHELSYDKAFSKHDRIYRVVNDLIVEDEVEKASITHGALAPTLAADFPEVEAAVRMINRNKQVLRLDEKAIAIEHVFWVDSNYFQLFDYKLLAGNPKTALQEPNTLVLSKDVAGKFFSDPMQAMLSTFRIGSQTYKVTGIFEPVDAAHMRPNVLTSLNTLSAETRRNLGTDWFGTSSYTYLLLRNAHDAAGLEAKLPEFVERRITPIRRSATTERVVIHMQALPDIHLNTDYLWEAFPVGNKSYIYIFAFVGLFILLIASINYMNLATARSAKRAKEVGLRKVVGASRLQLVLQFLSESVLLTLIAVVLALGLLELLLPMFNNLANKQIPSTFFTDPSLLVLILGIAVFIGLVAGSYPAFILSHFRPVDTLKTDKVPNGGGAMLRKSLVVLQFSISLVMIIGTVVVYSQMQFLKSQDLGFTKEQVVVIDIPSGDTTLVNKMSVIKTELLKDASITEVATSAMIPGEETGVIIFNVERGNGMAEKTMNTIWVDYDFFDLMDIPVTAGRNFSKDMGTDPENGYILNEAAVKALGWADPVGKRIGFTDTTSGRVIGVVRNFNYKSLHSQIEPLVILLAPRNNGSLMAKISPGDLRQTMTHIESTWQRFAPTHPMDYFFLDESFNKQYLAEEKMLTIFGYFSLLTIIIACLGLFGLASFTAEQRTKEIGIRKVLGSSTGNIVLLLSKDFALLVLIAIVLASPVAWYGMSQWLQDFAYRVDLSWWIFVLAGLLALVIALATVSFQAVKAALLDPVKAIRTQ